MQAAEVCLLLAKADALCSRGRSGHWQTPQERWTVRLEEMARHCVATGAAKGRANVPTSSALCGRHVDKIYVAQRGRVVNFICTHLPLVMSLRLVQLLAVPCEQPLLHPVFFKAPDFDFQSNHVKSYCLLFLILYATYLISFQYLCLKSALFCVCLVCGDRVGPDGSGEKRGRNKRVFC